MGGVEGGCRSQDGFWNRSTGRPRQVGVSQGCQGLGTCVPVRAVEIGASASGDDSVPMGGIPPSK